MSNSNEIAVIEVTPELAPAIYVSGGLKGYFEQVKQAVEGEVPDLTTKKGRDRVASLAAQVSRSKTAVEKPGREYLKRIKELPKEVEAELREWVRGCDELRDQVREPLTAIENQYKERISSIAVLGDAGGFDGVASSVIRDCLDQLSKADISDMWPEWQKEAAPALDLAIKKAESALAKAIKAEEGAAEMARIQAENARLEQEARDRRIAEQAAENARQEEARRQQAERDASERRELEARRLAQEAVEKEEKARRDAEQAEAARQQAEARRIAEAEQAETARQIAQQKAADDAARAAEMARQAERQRVDDERIQRENMEARRLADREHMGRINRGIVADMAKAGLSDEQAKQLIRMIVSGEIKNVTIKY